MSKHIPNKRQVKAFERVVNAIKSAQKSGLVFHGKQFNLTAYTKQANEYAEKNCPLHKLGDLDLFGEIPFLDAQVLFDSGADDYAQYISNEDREKFNPE